MIWNIWSSFLNLRYYNKTKREEKYSFEIYFIYLYLCCKILKLLDKRRTHSQWCWHANYAQYLQWSIVSCKAVRSHFDSIQVDIWGINLIFSSLLVQNPIVYLRSFGTLEYFSARIRHKFWGWNFSQLFVILLSWI